MSDTRATQRQVKQLKAQIETLKSKHLEQTKQLKARLAEQQRIARGCYWMASGLLDIFKGMS